MDHLKTTRLLKMNRQKYASDALALQVEKMPEMVKRYSEHQMNKALQDMIYHLQFLETAFFAKSTLLFANYLVWLKGILENYGVPLRDLKMSVIYLGQILESEMPEVYEKGLSVIIDEGLKKLDEDSVLLKTFLSKELHYSQLAEDYLGLLLKGERYKANQLIQEALKNGAPIKKIYIQVFQNTQYEIGRLWQTGKISVAQEHYCTAASQFIMTQLYPYIFRVPNKGVTIVATCVGNELHEVGIRMVADFMELSGFNTYYLGANTPAESIIKTLIENKPSILAVSATMSFHVTEVAELIRKVRDNEECKGIKIIVGGYPFNIDQNLWKTIGADSFSQDSEGAVLAVLDLIKESD